MKFRQVTLLAQPEGIEKSSANVRASFGQDFFAINSLNLASVVCSQAALGFVIPGGLNLAQWILVQGNQENIHEAGSVFWRKCLALFSQLYHLVAHGGPRRKTNRLPLGGGGCFVRPDCWLSCQHPSTPAPTVAARQPEGYSVTAATHRPAQKSAGTVRQAAAY